MKAEFESWPAQARADDGLVAVAERAASVREGAAQKLDVLIVDASSGDPTLAMSCPSPAFLVSSLARTAMQQACSPAH